MTEPSNSEDMNINSRIEARVEALRMASQLKDVTSAGLVATAEAIEDTSCRA